VDGRQLKCLGVPDSQDAQLQLGRGCGAQHERSFSACRPAAMEKRNRCVSIADTLMEVPHSRLQHLVSHATHGRRRGTQIMCAAILGTKFSKSRCGLYTEPSMLHLSPQECPRQVRSCPATACHVSTVSLHSCNYTALSLDPTRRPWSGRRCGYPGCWNASGRTTSLHGSPPFQKSAANLHRTLTLGPESCGITSYP